jgi:hypothetical protein
MRNLQGIAVPQAASEPDALMEDKGGTNCGKDKGEDCCKILMATLVCGKKMIRPPMIQTI